MSQIRMIAGAVLALGGVLAAVITRRRTRLAERSSSSHRFISRRVVDREARDHQAQERWDDDGGR
jgi:hypothetical protein